ncbi:MAG: hypothetical protein ACXWZG_08690 [Microbacterium sp.]
MGQFTTRPEEPTEWAGLPSEPVESNPSAESVVAALEFADSLAILGGTIESVAIPLFPVVEIAPSAPDSDGGSPSPIDED